MLTTSPHLYIRRPSPTTAEFTVTTCPPPTLPLRLLLLTLHLLRLTLFTTAVLTLHTHFFLPTTTSTTTTHQALLPYLLAGDLPAALTTLLQAAHRSAPGTLLASLTAPLPNWAAAGLAAAALYLAVAFQLHTTESVLVLRGLGIQTCRSGKFGFGWGAKTRFIPTEKIRDVLINEAFRGFEVRYYLVVVVEGEEDVVVLFPGLLPRRKIVEAVWRGVRGCLMEKDGEKEKGG